MSTQFWRIPIAKKDGEADNIQTESDRQILTRKRRTQKKNKQGIEFKQPPYKDKEEGNEGGKKIAALLYGLG